MAYRCMFPIAASEKSTEIYQDVFSRLITERIVFLSQEIDAEVATEKAATLLLLNKLDATKEITLYINSSGGFVQDGLLTIYDTLQLISAPVRTICMGEAYSSAAIILAAGSKGRRMAYPSARIMIHNLQVEEMSGTQKQIEEESRRIKDLNHTLMQIISQHTGQPLKKVRRDCEKDKYFTPQEAIKYGLIDGIVTPLKHDSLDKNA